MNLPESFINRTKDIIPQYEGFVSCLDEANVRGINVNTNKISINDFVKLFPYKISKIPYNVNGFYLNEDFKIGSHPYHHAGLFYSQDPSAQAPICGVDIHDDWKVLDMCASPGGKSIQIASKLKNGFLISNEYDKKRSQILYSNIERMGFDNVIVTNENSSNLSKAFSGYFDLVVIDAPCSGEGMFRKSDISINEWSEKNIETCVSRQKEILDNASSMVKKDGYILYSTCTYELDENENMIKWFTENYNYVVVALNLSLNNYSVPGIGIPEARRFYPHISPGEGQFVCLLKNNNEVVEKNCFISHKKPTNSEMKIINDFLKHIDLDLEVYIINNKVYSSKCDKLNNLNIVSSGVQIGEVKHNYFIPNHNVFTAYGKYFKNKVNLNLDDNRVMKYLHGEEIQYDCENGYGVLMVDGYPIGGFKASNGNLKNHYPKGLRNN